jgi:PAS domain S-box-containing protein
MDRPMRVLLVEDSADDAEFTRLALREGGLLVESRLVAGEVAFREALEEFRPDVILADWAMPGFSGEAAVSIARQWDATVPCILVSGTLGEELVVQGLRTGATDYVLKQRLGTLAPAVRRALAEVAERRARVRLEAELAATQAAMRSSLDAMADPFLICSSERDDTGSIRGFRTVFANRAAAAFMGVSRETLTGALIPEGMPDLGGRPFLDVVRDVVETGRRFAQEDVELLVPDGGGARRRVVAIEIAPFREGFFATWRDVTEHRQAELEMRRLIAAIEQSTEAVVITDAAGQIEYVNAAFERVSGYTRAEAIGQNPRILKSGLQHAAFYEAMWATLTSGNPFVGDMTNRRKDGSLYEEEAVISPVVDKNCVITSYVAVKRDVTRERASDAARNRRARERVLIAGALADLQVLPTAAATAHLICRQVGRLTGIVGAVLYIFTPDGSALPVAVVRTDSAHVTLRRLAVPRSRRLRDRAEAGPWVEDWNSRPGHTQVFAGLAVRAVGYAPIRQGRRLIGLLTIASAEEDALSQLTESLPALLEFAGFAGALIGPAVADLAETSRIRKRIQEIIADTAFRPVFQPIIELATGAHIGYEALTRFSNGFAPDLVFADANAAGLGAELELATLAVAMAEATTLPRDAWLSLNVSPDLVIGGDALAGVLGRADRPLVLEITEHAPVGDYPALLRAISRLRPAVRVAVDDAGAGVANFSHIVDLRPAFVKMDIGLVRGIDTDPTRRALMVGLLHFASESASQTIAEGVENEAELATLKELGVPLAQGYLLGRPAPATEWAQGSETLPTGGDRGKAAAGMGELAVGTREDEAAEPDSIAPAQAEAPVAKPVRGDDPEVARTERLVAVGRFAGGIAHDFNNVLTAIRMYSQLARDGLPAGDPIRDDLDQVLESAERAAAITRTLLAFTRQETLAPLDVDPAAVITALMPILGSLLGDEVRIRLDIESAHGFVHADPTQLEQVLVNLAVNARDAMPTGGTLTIAVCNLPPIVGPPGTDPGPFVRLSVSDTGVGIDEATRLRIFDPFYTTKGEGKGTGLGLWTVSRIVAESGGRIDVETALGKGTTFHVDLPRVVTVMKQKLRKTAAKADGPRSGIVIVVDDDDSIKRLVQRSLEAVGYTVHAAANADEALQAVERWAGQIDVLVTDVAMPGLPGPELAALARATQPDIGVVFISGNAEEATIRGGDADGTWSFLQKPFSVESLRIAVGRGLDAAVRARQRRSPKG